MVLGSPVSAHTPGELAVWAEGWAARADHALTPDLLAEADQMRAVHVAFTPTPTPTVITPAAKSSPRPNSWTAERWRPLVERYFPAEQVPQAMRVIDCESGGNPDARNSTSGAAGLFQHLPRYWPARAAAAGLPAADPYDPEANIAVAAWLQRTGGWGHWTCR